MYFKLNRYLSATLTIVAITALMGATHLPTNGDWPDYWPVELEPYRENTESWSINGQIATHTIEFSTNKDFLNAWPYILDITENKFDIVLVPEKSLKRGKRNINGVEIWVPPHIKFIDAKGNFFYFGEHWPKSAYLPDGTLPEYITFKDGAWVPESKNNFGQFKIRARLQLIITCDSQIIDLNTMKFPENANIIDLRFEDTNVPSILKNIELSKQHLRQYLEN